MHPGQNAPITLPLVWIVFNSNSFKPKVEENHKIAYVICIYDVQDQLQGMWLHTGAILRKKPYGWPLMLSYHSLKIFKKFIFEFGYICEVWGSDEAYVLDSHLALPSRHRSLATCSPTKQLLPLLVMALEQGKMGHSHGEEPQTPKRICMFPQLALCTREPNTK